MPWRCSWHIYPFRPVKDPRRGSKGLNKLSPPLSHRKWGYFTTWLKPNFSQRQDRILLLSLKYLPILKYFVAYLGSIAKKKKNCNNKFVFLIKVRTSRQKSLDPRFQFPEVVPMLLLPTWLRHPANKQRELKQSQSLKGLIKAVQVSPCYYLNWCMRR